MTMLPRHCAPRVAHRSVVQAIAMPAMGRASVPAGGVSVPAGGVSVPAGGVGVPAGGVNSDAGVATSPVPDPVVAPAQRPDPEAGSAGVHRAMAPVRARDGARLPGSSEASKPVLAMAV